MKKFILIIFVSFLFFTAFAQESKKEHFIIHSTDSSIDIDKFYFAVDNWGHINEYRFYEKRRTISFMDEGVTLELYSAKELLELYGKQISPVTIMPLDEYKEISFALTLDGKSLKPQIINYK